MKKKVKRGSCIFSIHDPIQPMPLVFLSIFFPFYPPPSSSFLTVHLYTLYKAHRGGCFPRLSRREEKKCVFLYSKRAHVRVERCWWIRFFFPTENVWCCVSSLHLSTNFFSASILYFFVLCVGLVYQAAVDTPSLLMKLAPAMKAIYSKIAFVPPCFYTNSEWHETRYKLGFVPKHLTVLLSLYSSPVLYRFMYSTKKPVATA